MPNDHSVCEPELEDANRFMSIVFLGCASLALRYYHRGDYVAAILLGSIALLGCWSVLSVIDVCWPPYKEPLMVTDETPRFGR